jgi:hypothetical protein
VARCAICQQPGLLSAERGAGVCLGYEDESSCTPAVAVCSAWVTATSRECGQCPLLLYITCMRGAGAGLRCGLVVCCGLVPGSVDSPVQCSLHPQGVACLCRLRSCNCTCHLWQAICTEWSFGLKFATCKCGQLSQPSTHKCVRGQTQVVGDRLLDSVCCYSACSLCAGTCTTSLHVREP